MQLAKLRLTRMTIRQHARKTRFYHRLRITVGIYFTVWVKVMKAEYERQIPRKFTVYLEPSITVWVKVSFFSHKFPHQK